MKKLFLIFLLFPSICFSQVKLFCPYEAGFTDDGIPNRVLSVNRFANELRIQQNITDLRITPWEEDEVAGASRVDPNRAIVTIPEGLAIQTQLVTSFVLNGANCSLVPVDYIRQPARTPRYVDGNFNYDRIDNNRKVINPHRDRRSSLEEKLIKFVNKIFNIPLAWALDTFPDSTQLKDNFNRADENPISGTGWSSPANSASGARIISNTICGNAAATAGSAYYSGYSSPSDNDAYVTFLAANGLRIYARWIEPDNNGYNFRLNSSTAESMNRVDAGTETQLGSTLTGQTHTSGDLWGIRVEGSTIKGFQNAGSWSEKMSNTDSTYSAGGVFAIQLNTSAQCADNLYITTATATRKNSVIQWR